MEPGVLSRKYVKDLEINFLPFWEKAIDKKYGGVFTCYTNKGDELKSERKYIWSQGRFLWLCCHLQILKEKGIIHLAKDWDGIAEKTYQFLMENALMCNNHAVFVVERDGQKIEGQMDISIFADCFYVLGCNAYAKFKNDMNGFEKALHMYNLIKERVRKNEFRSEPYPIPAGYRSHSIPMILLNVSEELQETANVFNHHSKANLERDVKGFLEEILKELSDGERIKEMQSFNPKREKTLLERHINPGHTLECVWFMIHSIEQLKLDEKGKYLSVIANISSKALSTGWDDRYGGLLRFVDKEGGIPYGDEMDTPYESLVKDTWDLKLWWPHSEALYTSLLLFYTTKDHFWLQWYQKIERYVFRTFPNKNEEIGEWVQIRNRKGDPLEKVVGLPVKDPFHIIRNYLLIIDLLESGASNDVLALPEGEI